MHTKIKLIALLCTMAMMQTAMAQKASRYEFSIEQAVAYASKKCIIGHSSTNANQ